ncbi:MAG: translation initiation factor IF-2 [Candidatus Omnitrophota bacterium]|nr:translation initiation factor IF-2 [Candidatus Omnitrophota bacterium]MDZ4242108.1 translation initiation factor IF-2 [Candidatus Omnitrophota bacterium]
MKVADLAKLYNLSSDDVLGKLKAMKLKAKDSQQELSGAVVAVLRSELGKMRPSASVKKPEPPKAKDEIKEAKPVKEAKAAKPAKAAKTAAAAEPPAAKSKVSKITKKAAPEKAKEAVKPEEPAPVPPAAVKADPAPAAAPAVTESAAKSRVPISSEPFVAVKPTLKRKRRPMGRSDHFGRPHAHPGEALPGAGEPSGSFSAPAFTDGAGAAVSGLKPLEINVPITVKDFAVKVQEKVSVILKQLMQMGVLATINQNLGEDIVRKLAHALGYEVTQIKTLEQQLIDVHKEEQDDPSLLKSRAPVVTFMGHVDHGKTSLLDKIRKSKVAEGEHGGITQHIGAYSVSVSKGRITFLDTPGHEAFTAMRARGAHITDLVVLVVAADEGIMPQTTEALDHARAAGVPIVVALNKIDRPNADQDGVKKQLMNLGLVPEEWWVDGMPGKKTVVVGVSALTGEGIDSLLEMILLEAELLELRANYDKKATGIVVDAHMSQGRGSVADLIIQSGTLRSNDIVVVGPHYGKIKAMFDDRERPITESGPSTPVQILGLPAVPEAGELFYVVEDEKRAREITQVRQEYFKAAKLRPLQKITLEDLYSHVKEGKLKELNVILKADVQGSVEALQDSLEKIPSEEVKIKFIHLGVGDINASDVILAVASNAIIIGFHVELDTRGQEELEKQPVDVRLYRIIYDAVNDIRKALEGLLEPKLKKKFLSRIEVRQVFKLSKSGIVAGCFVVKGKVHRKAKAELIRNGEVAYTGSISSLKRFKDDVRDVAEGFECGLTLEGFDKFEPGDIIEAFEVESIARTL